MWKLVRAGDSAATQAAAEKWLRGETSAHELDPLIVTLLEIRKKALELGADEHSCYLCSVERLLLNADAGVQWVDNCTDAVLLLCYANRVLTPS